MYSANLWQLRGPYPQWQLQPAPASSLFISVSGSWGLLLNPSNSTGLSTMGFPIMLWSLRHHFIGGYNPKMDRILPST